MTDTVTIPRAEFEKIREAIKSFLDHHPKCKWKFAPLGECPNPKCCDFGKAEQALAILEKHGGGG